MYGQGLSKGGEGIERKEVRRKNLETSYRRT